jgi:hypothetical protein
MLALLLGALALSAPLLRVAADEDLVVVLTEANFEEKIKGSKFALVRQQPKIATHDLVRPRPCPSPHPPAMHPLPRRLSSTPPGAATARSGLESGRGAILEANARN